MLLLGMQRGPSALTAEGPCTHLGGKSCLSDALQRNHQLAWSTSTDRTLAFTLCCVKIGRKHQCCLPTFVVVEPLEDITDEHVRLFGALLPAPALRRDREVSMTRATHNAGCGSRLLLEICNLLFESSRLQTPIEPVPP